MFYREVIAEELVNQAGKSGNIKLSQCRVSINAETRNSDCSERLTAFGDDMSWCTLGARQHYALRIDFLDEKVCRHLSIDKKLLFTVASIFYTIKLFQA